MRRQISLKSNTCTESMDVDAAGISVKVGAQYPGRSVNLPCATVAGRQSEGLAEVSRGHSRTSDRTEGPNVEHWEETLISMTAGDAEGRDEKSATNGRGPWWNSGASHMNDAFRKSHFDNLGLVSLLDRLHQIQYVS